MKDKIGRVRVILHIAGIVISSLMAALSSYTVGGDPAIGAAFGAGINAIVASISH